MSERKKNNFAKDVKNEEKKKVSKIRKSIKQKKKSYKKTNKQEESINQPRFDLKESIVPYFKHECTKS